MFLLEESIKFSPSILTSVQLALGNRDSHLFTTSGASDNYARILDVKEAQLYH